MWGPRVHLQTFSLQQSIGLLSRLISIFSVYSDDKFKSYRNTADNKAYTKRFVSDMPMRV